MKNYGKTIKIKYWRPLMKKKICAADLTLVRDADEMILTFLVICDSRIVYFEFQNFVFSDSESDVMVFIHM